MFKKRFATISTATLLILGVSLSPITPSQTAHAAAPACSDVGNYTTALQADSRYDPSHTAFMVFKRDWSGPYWNGMPGLAVDWNGASDGNAAVMLTGYDSGSGRYSITLGIGSATNYTINSDGTLNELSLSGGSSIGPADINCISVYQHPDYEANGVNANPGGVSTDNLPPGADSNGDGEIDAPPSEPCDWYDLVCVMQKVYLSVTNGFTQLMNWLGNVITDIVGPIIEAIIPGADNDTIFSDMFNGLKSGLEAKLGFLTYPFEWFGSFFSNIQAISWTGSFAPSCIYNSQGVGVWAYCTTSFEVWHGQSLTIDWGSMEKRLPAVWNVSIIFVRFIFLIAIIEMLRRAYFRTVKA